MLTVRRVPRTAAPVTAGLAAAESVTAFALAHTAAGGSLPGAGWLLFLGVLGFGAGVAVLGRGLPIRVVAPVLVAAQVLAHGWLVALQPAAHAGHGTMGPETSAPLGLTWTMLIAHVVAGVVAAAAWALRRRAVAVLLAWSDPTPAASPLPAAERVRGALVVLRADRWCATVPMRGPPAGWPLPV